MLYIDRGALNGFIVYKQFDYLEKAFRLQSNVDDDINRSGALWYYKRIERIFYRTDQLQENMDEE